MPRQPEHRSGAKQSLTIRIPPAHLEGLRAKAAETGVGVSRLIERLIERAKLVSGTKDNP